MDLREELFSNTLDLPIYEKYKELHTSSEIKILYFNSSDIKQLEYGFSNLTTLQKLGDSYYFLTSLATLEERIKNANDFFINMHPVINGFFVSLVGALDSMAYEINILFCNGRLSKDKIDFNSIHRKIKKRLNQLEGSGNITTGLQMVKTKVGKMRAEEWYKQIIAYRNGLVHSHVIFVAFRPDTHKPYLIRANLRFQEIIKKVWPGTERLEKKDFYSNLTVYQQCEKYFNAVKKSVKEFWEMFFEILKSSMPFPYPK